MAEKSITRRGVLAAAAAGTLLKAASQDVCDLPAHEITSLIRRKKVSAEEVMKAHLARIERVNPKVNAIVTLVADQALASARKADRAFARGAKPGILHGLPVGHKDLVDTAGIRTTYGSRIFKDHVPTADAIQVEKIRAAGAINVGKTNTPEYGAGSQTFNEVFGATRNPWDPTKTCGGSSGGAAVAVATGMMPIADGSDSGGSLRNPPAFCGVVGIRPSPGRVPSAAKGNPWLTISVNGPVARNVRDTALLLAAMSGSDSRSVLSNAEPPERFLGKLDRDFKGTRVAWFKDMGGIPFEPKIVEMVNAQRKVFESLGCIVEQAEPDWTGAHEGYDILRAWNFAAAQADNIRRYPELMKDTIHWEFERGMKITAADLTRAHNLRSQAWENMRRFQEKYEYFIAPVTQVLPFDVTQPYPTEIAGVRMGNYVEWQKSCILISAMENPALSLPCGFTAEGLPVGLQIVSRHRDEFAALQLGYAFEQARALNRRPVL